MLALIGALLVSVVIVEFAIRFMTTGGMNWQWPEGLQVRIQKAREIAAPRVAIVGDSFVEYFRGNDANIVNQMNKMAAEEGQLTRFVNLGYSGEGIRQYRTNLRRFAEEVEIASAVIVIHTGTDYVAFIHDEQQSQRRVSCIPRVGQDPVSLRSYTVTWRTWLRKSELFMFVFRVILKGGLGLFRNEATLPAAIRTRRCLFPIEDATLERRMAEVPDDLKTLAGRDRINPYYLAGGVVTPWLFAEIADGFAMYPALAERAFSQLGSSVRGMLNECTSAGIECRVAFADPAPLLGASTHEFYESLGFTMGLGVIREARFTARLKRVLDGLGVEHLDFRDAFGSREAELFLYPGDGHWNAEGHRVAAEAIYDRWFRGQVGADRPSW